MHKSHASSSNHVCSSLAETAMPGLDLVSAEQKPALLSGVATLRFVPRAIQRHLLVNNFEIKLFILYQISLLPPPPSPLPYLAANLEVQCNSSPPFPC